jgi:hypothetical protein
MLGACWPLVWELGLYLRKIQAEPTTPRPRHSTARHLLRKKKIRLHKNFLRDISSSLADNSLKWKSTEGW